MVLGHFKEKNMKLVKSFIMFRSFDAIYDFEKKNNGQNFWDVLVSEIRKDYSDCIMEKKGKMQGIIYFPSEDDRDVLYSKLSNLIKELLGSDEKFALTADFANEYDIERLRDNDIDGITCKPWFSAISNQVAGTPVAAAQSPVNTVPAEKSGLTDKQEKTGIPTADLFSEIKRIDSLRGELLKTVKGQRHAVEKVVQELFEGDLFTVNDSEHKGPFASFLFLGPSGVGKTFLATKTAKLLGKETLVLDMTDYSLPYDIDKLVGTGRSSGILADFVYDHPDGIVIFDEIEKASPFVIQLFLQILDEGRLMDVYHKRRVFFDKMTVFMTSNAGHRLYEDPMITNLSGISKRTIINALKTEMNPQTRAPLFPECLTTRFASGNVILFNHLEPYALADIVKDEISQNIGIFEKSCGISVKYKPDEIAALIIYGSGGTADARFLRANAKDTIIGCLQELLEQIYKNGGEAVNKIGSIEIQVDTVDSEDDTKELFSPQKIIKAFVYADEFIKDAVYKERNERLSFMTYRDNEGLKKALRGAVDFILIDPYCGIRDMELIPNDVEDISSDGMDMFRYILEYHRDIPVYLLDSRHKGEKAYSTLLAQGARRVIDVDCEDMSGFADSLAEVSDHVIINNMAYKIGRSGKALSYNASQFIMSESEAMISFGRLALRLIPRGEDKDSIASIDPQSGIRFKDVIGCKAAKEELERVCKIITDPRESISKGMSLPKGILLYGPPGTGKTMLAKAMANEADAAFFPITATTFFGPYVGETENNIRELFAKARRYAPSIIFIDEVDSVARKRTGSVNTASNEDALTALLAEMDGFVVDERRPVFIMAATNYNISGTEGQVLDPAFVRRFDKRLFIDLPDTDDRYQLVSKLFKKRGITLAESHEEVLRNFATRSSGLNNADISKIVEHFIRALETSEPTSQLLMEMLDNFRFGEIREVDADSLMQTAIHESGHALLNRLSGETPAFLTVVSRGNVLGFMEHDRDDKKNGSTFDELMWNVCCSLAGRAAEKLFYGESSGNNTGASSDLRNARNIIKYAVEDLAMGKYFYKKYTEDEMEDLLREQYERTVALIEEHKEVIKQLAEKLVAEKNLDKPQLEKFFSEHGI